MAVHQQVPLHALGGIAVGLDAMRGDLAVEQKGQLESEHARLAGGAARRRGPVGRSGFLL